MCLCRPSAEAPLPGAARGGAGDAGALLTTSCATSPPAFPHLLRTPTAPDGAVPPREALPALLPRASSPSPCDCRRLFLSRAASTLVASLGLRAWSLQAAARCLPAARRPGPEAKVLLSCLLRSQQGKMPTPGRARGDSSPLPNLRRSWEDTGHESWTAGGCLQRRPVQRQRGAPGPSSPGYTSASGLAFLLKLPV